MAGLPERAAAADDHLLGAGRHLLHARRGRVLSQGSTQGRDASTELRPFRRRGLLADHRRQDEGLLSTRSGCLIGPEILRRTRRWSELGLDLKTRRGMMGQRSVPSALSLANSLPTINDLL